jgi:hypothetical protein
MEEEVRIGCVSRRNVVGATSKGIVGAAGVDQNGDSGGMASWGSALGGSVDWNGIKLASAGSRQKDTIAAGIAIVELANTSKGFNTVDSFENFGVGVWAKGKSRGQVAARDIQTNMLSVLYGASHLGMVVRFWERLFFACVDNVASFVQLRMGQRRSKLVGEERIYLWAVTGVLHHDRRVTELLNKTVFALDSCDNNQR